MINPELAKQLEAIRKLRNMTNTEYVGLPPNIQAVNIELQIAGHIAYYIKTHNDVQEVNAKCSANPILMIVLSGYVSKNPHLSRADENIHAHPSKSSVSTPPTSLPETTHSHPSSSRVSTPPTKIDTVVKANPPVNSNISLLILNGFIAVMGIAAVAVGLVLGSPLIAVLGFATAIVGVGFFAANVSKIINQKLGFQLNQTNQTVQINNM